MASRRKYLNPLTVNRHTNESSDNEFNTGTEEDAEEKIMPANKMSGFNLPSWGQGKLTVQSAQTKVSETEESESEIGASSRIRAKEESLMELQRYSSEGESFELEPGLSHSGKAGSIGEISEGTQAREEQGGGLHYLIPGYPPDDSSEASVDVGRLARGGKRNQSSDGKQRSGNLSGSREKVYGKLYTEPSKGHSGVVGDGRSRSNDSRKDSYRTKNAARAERSQRESNRGWTLNSNWREGSWAGSCRGLQDVHYDIEPQGRAKGGGGVGRDPAPLTVRKDRISDAQSSCNSSGERKNTVNSSRDDDSVGSGTSRKWRDRKSIVPAPEGHPSHKHVMTMIELLEEQDPREKQYTVISSDLTTLIAEYKERAGSGEKTLFIFTSSQDKRDSQGIISRLITEAEMERGIKCKSPTCQLPETTAGSGKPANLGIYGKPKDVAAVFRKEVEYHLNQGEYLRGYALMAMSGRVTAAVEDAKKRKKECHLLNLIRDAPESFKTCADLEEEADRMLKDGKILETAVCLTQCGPEKVNDAIQLLRAHRYFREAAALSGYRLVAEDPLRRTVFHDWADHLGHQGEYEAAAKCSLAVNDFKNATRFLGQDHSHVHNMVLAVRVGRIVGSKKNQQIIKKVYFNLLTNCQWKMLDSRREDLQIDKYWMCVGHAHQALVRRLQEGLDWISTGEDRIWMGEHKEKGEFQDWSKNFIRGDDGLRKVVSLWRDNYGLTSKEVSQNWKLIQKIFMFDSKSTDSVRKQVLFMVCRICLSLFGVLGDCSDSSVEDLKAAMEVFKVYDRMTGPLDAIIKKTAEKSESESDEVDVRLSALANQLIEHSCTEKDE